MGSPRRDTLIIMRENEMKTIEEREVIILATASIELQTISEGESQPKPAEPPIFIDDVEYVTGVSPCQE